MIINVTKLCSELNAAGILCSGCSSDGVVWGADGVMEIQDRADVAAVIAAHGFPGIVNLRVDSDTLIGDGQDEIVLSIQGVPSAEVTIDVLTGVTPSQIQVQLDANGNGEQVFSCETAPCVIVFSAGDVSCKVRAL